MTVGGFANARGRSVDEVLHACRAAGVIAWSAHAPLDGDEVKALDAALAAPPPPVFAPIGSPPPPPPAARLLPPPPAGSVWPGPPPPPMPTGPRRRRAWKLAVGLGALALVAGRIGIGVVLGNAGEDLREEEAREDLQEILGADHTDDVQDRMAAFALVEGDCYEDTTGRSDPTEVVEARVEEVACDQPHDAEVYALVEHPAASDSDFPGDDAMVEYAIPECLSRFEAFVGLPYGQSRLDITFVFPQDDAWSVLDERTVICSVLPLDGVPLVGSMRGTAA